MEVFPDSFFSVFGDCQSFSYFHMLSAGYRAITITKNHKRLTKIARYRTITIGRYHEELTKIGKNSGICQ